MRSAAEGEHRTGEDVGEAEPLMLMEAIEPIGKGEGRRAKPATPAPAASRARTDAGCKPKGLAQAKRGGLPGW